MKISKEEEHLVKNIKSSASGWVYVYFVLGIAGLIFVLLKPENSVVSMITLFLSGMLCGISIEKFYNIKIYRLCIKLYQDFRLR